MKDTIEWRLSAGGSMGAHKMLMVRNSYVGHFYEDASDDVNAAQVMEDIEIRYNSHRLLVDALRCARDRLDPLFEKDELFEQIDFALKFAHAYSLE